LRGAARPRLGFARTAGQDDATGGQGKKGETVVATKHHGASPGDELSETEVLIKGRDEMRRWRENQTSSRIF
jgi:hypothetical protein